MTLTAQRADGTAVGTAFLCIKDGVAATAWHVVSGAQRVVAKFSTGEEFEVSGLIDKDETRDVALIRVKVADRTPLALASGDPVVGSKAFAIGAPRGLEFSISDGLVSQIQNIDGVKQFQYTCPTSPGNSGGPLINGKGEVLGVVSWQLRDSQNLNFAVPVTYVRGLDATLPTQPWAMVKRTEPVPATTASAPPTNPAAFQSAFVAGLWAYTEGDAAFDNAAETVVAKSSGFKNGPTVEQLQVSIQIAKAVQGLNTVSSSDAKEDKARLQLIDMLQGLNRALMGEKEAIEIAQQNQGWSPAANTRIKEAIAEFSLSLNGEGREDFWAYVRHDDEIVKLPLPLQELFQPGGDGTNFSLMALNWPRNPTVFARVHPQGFGYSLGFRTGDTVLEAGGQPVKSAGDLKNVIKSNLGKNVKVRLVRDGKEKEIEIKIPKEIPKSALVRRS